MSCYLSVYLFVSKEHLEQLPEEAVIQDKAIYLNSFSRSTALYDAVQETGMPYNEYFDLGNHLNHALAKLNERITNQRKLLADVVKFLEGKPSWKDYSEAISERNSIQEILDANLDAYATLKVFQDILSERKYCDGTTYLIGLES